VPVEDAKPRHAGRLGAIMERDRLPHGLPPVFSSQRARLTCLGPRCVQSPPREHRKDPTAAWRVEHFSDPARNTLGFALVAGPLAGPSPMGENGCGTNRRRRCFLSRLRLSLVWRRGPSFEGSRHVASSTPVGFSVPYRSPGQAHIENLPHVREGTVHKPIEVEVDESQQGVGRVAAIDVATATGMVCTRVPPASTEGKRATKVWEAKAKTKGLLELADYLVANKVQRTALESTSDYRRPFI
jgi:hypothetical protein